MNTHVLTHTQPAYYQLNIDVLSVFGVKAKDIVVFDPSAIYKEGDLVLAENGRRRFFGLLLEHPETDEFYLVRSDWVIRTSRSETKILGVVRPMRPFKYKAP